MPEEPSLPLHLASLDEPAVLRIAELIALKLKAGDVIALSGDLGAGKTTFARALIRAVLGDREAEVPSPTFSLVQSYASPRLALTHADLYRLSDPSEMGELGLSDAARLGAVLVEWPEKGDDIERIGDLLTVSLADIPGWPDRRDITISAGSAAWEGRLQRIGEIRRFLEATEKVQGIRIPGIRYLQGDASPRAYARLDTSRGPLILMDSPRQPDGPPIRDGLPYSRIAHLAEDVGTFLAVGRLLREGGFSAPEAIASDLEMGLLLIEDLGDRVFGEELRRGASQEGLWRAATDVLVALRQRPFPRTLPVDGALTYSVPDFDRSAMAIETGLFVDWYWPAALGKPIPDATRRDFTLLWSDVIDRLLDEPPGLVLRDYHSPNLMWLPERSGLQRIGILDFQDAMRGPWGYDLVSLLQDARVDVPPDLERALLAHYCREVGAREPDFDPDRFSATYAVLGAQRNTKILGIFARLAQRDRKMQYLRHIPRIWRYLARCLVHPELASLGAWYDAHVPPPLRSIPSPVPAASS